MKLKKLKCLMLIKIKNFFFQSAPVFPNDRQQNNIRQYISVTRPSGASTLDSIIKIK